MKKLCLLWFFIATAYFSNAQSNVFPSSGNVGVGTVNPAVPLDIIAPSSSSNIVRLKISDAQGDYLAFKNSTMAEGQFIPSIVGNHISDGRSALYIVGQTDMANDTGNSGIICFDGRTTSGTLQNRPLFQWKNYGATKMTMFADGSVGLGTANYNGTYKLSVNGRIRSKEIKVEATNWPDYVFEDNYRLLPLPDLASYISKNNHLPGIPDREEVKKEGLRLGEMNAKLLQKVEELTLYAISQEKQLQCQERQLAQNGSWLSALEARIEKLENLLTQTTANEN